MRINIDEDAQNALALLNRKFRLDVEINAYGDVEFLLYRSREDDPHAWDHADGMIIEVPKSQTE